LRPFNVARKGGTTFRQSINNERIFHPGNVARQIALVLSGLLPNTGKRPWQLAGSGGRLKTPLERPLAGRHEEGGDAAE
jgi:hypothetical protein